jgi:hypothetical protein
MHDAPVRGGKQVKAVLLGFLALAFVSGCQGGNDEEQIVSWATPDMPFAIVYPTDGQVVNARVIYVKGVGLPEGSHSLWCRAHTNTWYEQPGDLQTSSNGSWKTTVHLGGQGHYNNHIIEVGATLPDGRRVTARVSNIAVR